MILNGFLSKLKLIITNKKQKFHPDTSMLKQRLSKLSTQWVNSGETEGGERENPLKTDFDPTTLGGCQLRNRS